MNTNIRVALLAIVAALSGPAQAALFDRGGGLIYDSVLNITWLQNANYGAGSIYDNGATFGGSSTTDGRMTWQNAMSWADNLSYYDSVRNVTYTDWRLPTTNPVNGSSFNYNFSNNGSTDSAYNISATGSAHPGTTASELAFMYYQNLGNLGFYNSVAAPTNCLANGTPGTCLDNVGPFINLQTSNYWSGTQSTADVNRAFYLGATQGEQGTATKTLFAMYAWAVRPGDIANLLPVSQIGGPYAITAGDNLLLNGVASYDPDYVADSIVQYAWDLNGDATYDIFGATPSVDPTTLTGLGMGAGTYTLALKVTDTHGTYGVSTTSLTIAAVPEPETYAMMLAGLGLVGFAARTRRDARG